jgi:serine/threonine protein kinase
VTPLYRAPEVFIGEEDYDNSIDIWSLGCIFFEIISKQAPFKGENQLEILNSIFK